MEIVMSGIAKAFGTNQVLRDVSITLKEGEVHALMGENGAGKSTLMNILTGIHKADAGKITIDGVERTFPNPREAELNGVAFIHQELNIWPNLTLLENLYLMRPKRNKFGMLDKKAMLEEAQNTCRELGIELPLTTEAGLCSVGHQQMTEILRILMLDAKVVIMDEPTAALTERETATLFKMMRKMKARGVAIVYISHRMEEVFSECDTITVMRDGHTIITKPTAEISVDEVVRHMVGRSRDVSITLKEGEVHALMGENGAGKSTLMNILTGIHKADAGKITIDGVERTFPNPREAELNGVAFIHQELNIWPNLTLLENLYLMRPKRNKFGMLDKKAMLEEAQNTCRELGIELPLTTEAGLCSVGHQQMTEILRILMLDAKVVIMDEPTAALTERETATLFKMMRKMKARGVAIVYISHRMEEVFSECDTITVMRDGHTIITKPTAEISVDEVVRHMVGRSIDEFYPARTTTPGEVVMSVDNLKPEGFDNDISFSLRKGEILGVAGLMGAGRTEIMRAIFGVDKHNGGTVTVNGSVLNCKKPEDSIKAGIAFITENRKSEGLILDFSIGSNITLPNLGEICPSHVLDKGKLNSFADELSKKLGVKTQSIHEPASSLSGGNQQKVVIAKWVGKKPSIIIMDEPTRGIDIGAKRDIYDLMNELTNDGVSIIMVSSELPEVLGMSDRVMVIHEGRVAGILDRSDATPESIMTLATGGQ